MKGRKRWIVRQTNIERYLDRETEHDTDREKEGETEIEREGEKERRREKEREGVNDRFSYLYDV